MTLPPPTAGTTVPEVSPPSVQSAWSPLRIVVFRWLWIATLVSQIGTWAQEAGGPWLMNKMVAAHSVSLMVALVSVAEYLPICLLSLPGGALADVFDRRKLLIFSQIWMLVASGLLGIITLTGFVNPPVLLLFTFFLGVGTALSGPAFQAIVPELVPPGDMPLAVALNSVALNVARAIGPALGMAVVWLAGSGIRGTGASFVLNSITFIGVAWVLYEWRRPAQASPPRPERVLGAIQLGFHYTRHSPPMRAILLRVFLFIFCAVAMWSQLAVIATRQLHMEGGGYGILYGCLGAGAVVGVVVMPRLQRKLQIDNMVVLCTAAFALGLAALSAVSRASLAYPIMLFIGFNWVIIPTNFNVATQKSVPNWVRSRALAMYLTTLWGTWTLASFFWGEFADRTSISTALVVASIGMALGLLLTGRYPLTRAAGQDLTPAFKGPQATPAAPEALGDLSTCPGVRICTLYVVSPERTSDFETLAADIRRQRLRNGAYAWSLQRAVDDTGHWIETYDFRSPGDWSRFHGRTTKADLELQQALHAHHIGSTPPLIEHERHTPLPGLLSRESLLQHMVTWADRAMEECENAIDRLTASPPRR